MNSNTTRLFQWNTKASIAGKPDLKTKTVLVNRVYGMMASHMPMSTIRTFIKTFLNVHSNYTPFSKMVMLDANGNEARLDLETICDEIITEASN